MWWPSVYRRVGRRRVLLSPHSLEVPDRDGPVLHVGRAPRGPEAAPELLARRAERRPDGVLGTGLVRAVTGGTDPSFLLLEVQVDHRVPRIARRQHAWLRPEIPSQEERGMP